MQKNSIKRLHKNEPKSRGSFKKRTMKQRKPRTGEDVPLHLKGGAIDKNDDIIVGGIYKLNNGSYVKVTWKRVRRGLSTLYVQYTAVKNEGNNVSNESGKLTTQEFLRKATSITVVDKIYYLPTKKRIVKVNGLKRKNNKIQVTYTECESKENSLPVDQEEFIQATLLDMAESRHFGTENSYKEFIKNTDNIGKLVTIHGCQYKDVKAKSGKKTIVSTTETGILLKTGHANKMGINKLYTLDVSTRTTKISLLVKNKVYEELDYISVELMDDERIQPEPGKLVCFINVEQTFDEIKCITKDTDTDTDTDTKTINTYTYINTDTVLGANGRREENIQTTGQAVIIPFDCIKAVPTVTGLYDARLASQKNLVIQAQQQKYERHKYVMVTTFGTCSIAMGVTGLVCTLFPPAGAVVAGTVTLGAVAGVGVKVVGSLAGFIGILYVTRMRYRKYKELRNTTSLVYNLVESMERTIRLIQRYNAETTHLYGKGSIFDLFMKKLISLIEMIDKISLQFYKKDKGATDTDTKTGMEKETFEKLQDEFKDAGLSSGDLTNIIDSCKQNQSVVKQVEQVNNDADDDENDGANNVVNDDDADVDDSSEDKKSGGSLRFLWKSGTHSTTEAYGDLIREYTIVLNLYSMFTTEVTAALIDDVSALKNLLMSKGIIDEKQFIACRYARNLQSRNIIGEFEGYAQLQEEAEEAEEAKAKAKLAAVV